MKKKFDDKLKDELMKEFKSQMDLDINEKELEKDFDFICKSIGVEERLSFINRSPDRREYKDFYKSKEQIKMIEEMYAKDLERFGYGFE